MLDFARWVNDSHALAIKKTEQRAAKFRQGSWWGAFRIEPKLIWPSFQAFYNSLTSNTDGPFRWLERYATNHEADKTVAFFQPGPTILFWRVGWNGFGYCRQTLSEDRPDVSATPGTLLLKSPVIERAQDVVRRAKALASGRTAYIHMGWDGIENRQVFDQESNTVMGYMVPTSVESPEVECGPNTYEVSVAQALTAQLFQPITLVRNQ